MTICETTLNRFDRISRITEDFLNDIINENQALFWKCYFWVFSKKMFSLGSPVVFPSYGECLKCLCAESIFHIFCLGPKQDNIFFFIGKKVGRRRRRENFVCGAVKMTKIFSLGCFFVKLFPVGSIKYFRKETISGVEKFTKFYP